MKDARFCDYRNGKFYWRRIRLPYWFARWFFDGARAGKGSEG